jgi:hypothetical protein
MNDGGKMDKYTAGTSCSDPRNFAIWPATWSRSPTGTLAAANALADRYFQPIVGQSSSNDMYLAQAKLRVHRQPRSTPTPTGTAAPSASMGPSCTIRGRRRSAICSSRRRAQLRLLRRRLRGDEGRLRTCPAAPSDCPLPPAHEPLRLRPERRPLRVLQPVRRQPEVHARLHGLHDRVGRWRAPRSSRSSRASATTTSTPASARRSAKASTFVTSGHRGRHASVAESPADTLLLVTWDEGGGFFDHVTPPPASDRRLVSLTAHGCPSSPSVASRVRTPSPT